MAKKEVRKELRRPKAAGRRRNRKQRAVSVPAYFKRTPQMSNGMLAMVANDKLAAAAQLWAKQAVDPFNDSIPYTPYPRQQPEPVTMFYQKYDLSLSYASGINTSDPRYGQAGYVIYPALERPLWLWESFVSAAAVTVTGVIRRPTKLSGFFPTSSGGINESATTGVLEIDNTDFNNFVPLWTYSNETDSYGRPSIKSIDPAGDEFYGLPFYLGASSLTISVTIATDIIMNGQVVTLQAVGTKGIVTGTLTLPLAAANALTYTTNVAFSGIQTAMGGAYGCVLPNAPLGFRMKCDSVLRPVSVSVSLTTGGGDTIGRYTPAAALNSQTSYDFVEAYAVDAAAALCSYVGAELSNGGIGAGALYPGGRGAQLDQMLYYDDIAESRQGVSRPLKVGQYAIWKPSQESDMAFRDVSDLSPLTMPAIVHWLQVATPTQLNSIRLRVVLRYEAKTSDQTRQVVTAPANPLGVALALDMLREFPATHDNPLHWGDIKAFTSRMVGRVKEGYEWYNNNKSWINPAVAGIMAAVA